MNRASSLAVLGLGGLIAVGGLIAAVFLLKPGLPKWQVGDSAYYYEEDAGWIEFTVVDIQKLDETLAYLISDGLQRTFWIATKEFDKKLFSEAPIAYQLELP